MKKTCKQQDIVPLQEPLLNSLSRTSRYFSPGTKDFFKVQLLTLCAPTYLPSILFSFHLLTLIIVSSKHIKYYLQKLFQFSKSSNVNLFATMQRTESSVFIEDL